MPRSVAAQVEQRLNSLTKPTGSLGRLEEMVVHYCRIKGNPMPPMPRKGMFVFCGDHGVTEEGVSAYPREVTRQMAANFEGGGAAINVLCRHYAIDARFVDCGIGRPTRNLVREPAMTPAETAESIALRRRMAREAAEKFDAAGIGEMGIGNTTPAAALFSVFAGLPPSQTAGRGSGLDNRMLLHKIAIIEKAIALHQPDAANPMAVLAALGGREIAAMTGFILGAAHTGLAVVLDGFIVCTSALVAWRIDPTCLNNAIFSHCSAETGHGRLLDHLGVTAYFGFGMRLGEGSGAAVMLGLLDTALRLYREMATFEEAKVAERVQ
ncbi:MAG: nicotinate-nucleotide--dimethylbenzimidazole phosphoribosyltransferase [Acidobacteria bacterium]|nr:nicotinate-nucleotide--dimethylbenzimidazole phosphoribosyltransferase [Acidobacteriota bacterium]